MIWPFYAHLQHGAALQVAAANRTANFAATEDNDALSTTALLAIKATLTATEANDTLTSASDLVIKANFTATEANDTLSSTAGVTVASGNLNVVEENDVLSSGVANLLIEATFTITEPDDTIIAIGSGAGTVITGSVVVTNADDTLTSTNLLKIKANSATIDANDTLFAEGNDFVGNGDLIIFEEDDELNARTDVFPPLVFRNLPIIDNPTGLLRSAQGRRGRNL